MQKLEKRREKICVIQKNFLPLHRLNEKAVGSDALLAERRVGRVIDRAGLEIRYTLMGIGGLNPSLSAISITIGRLLKPSFFLCPHNYEIDFLLSRGAKLHTIEVKSSGYRTHRSLDVFLT